MHRPVSSKYSKRIPIRKSDISVDGFQGTLTMNIVQQQAGEEHNDKHGIENIQRVHHP